MRTLYLVLLVLSSCLQGGLAPTKDGQDPLSTTGGDDPGTPQLKISMLKNDGVFLKTDFGDTAYDETQPIRGYGLTSPQGSTFCFSNERVTNSDGLDTSVTCRRPLGQGATSTEYELLETLKDQTNYTSPTSIPTALHGLQLYFSNSTTAPAAVGGKFSYSTINYANLKIRVKTAPLIFDDNTGEFNWDSDKILTLDYKTKAGDSNCDPTDQYTVGFDLTTESSLGSDREKYFVTGLWIFERAPTKPYESSTVSPLGNYGLSGGGTVNAPSSLFVTRANVHASLLVPPKDVTDYLTFNFFPGPSSVPSDTPNPRKYTFGMYRGSTLPGDSGTSIGTNGEDTVLQVGSTLTSGAIVTPIMGKYNTSQQEITTSNGNGYGWKNRVIIGLCVEGTRTLYNESSSETANPLGPYPVIHALKYEMRRIKAFLD